MSKMNQLAPHSLLLALFLFASCSNVDQELLTAASRADSAAIHYSLNRGADPNTNLRPGETPLGLLLNRYKASDSARREIITKDVITLLAKGAAPNALHHGYTPLQTAAGLGNEDIVAHLLAHGANPSQETRAGLAPIWQCVYANDFHISRHLLEAGANPNALDAEGHTPLQYLRARGYIKTPLMLQLRQYGGH